MRCCAASFGRTCTSKNLSKPRRACCYEIAVLRGRGCASARSALRRWNPTTARTQIALPAATAVRAYWQGGMGAPAVDARDQLALEGARARNDELKVERARRRSSSRLARESSACLGPHRARRRRLAALAAEARGGAEPPGRSAWKRRRTRRADRPDRRPRARRRRLSARARARREKVPSAPPPSPPTTPGRSAAADVESEREALGPCRTASASVPGTAPPASVPSGCRRRVAASDAETPPPRAEGACPTRRRWRRRPRHATARPRASRDRNHRDRQRDGGARSPSGSSDSRPASRSRRRPRPRSTPACP